jgi:hypothetical protein
MIEMRVEVGQNSWLYSCVCLMWTQQMRREMHVEAEATQHVVHLEAEATRIAVRTVVQDESEATRLAALAAAQVSVLTFSQYYNRC